MSITWDQLIAGESAALEPATGSEAADRPRREWSAYQADVFAHWTTSSRNLRVDGVAGCGKTTTLEEMLKRGAAQGVSENSQIYLCFNRSIADEATGRMQGFAQTSTYHSFGFKALRAALPRNARVEKHKDYMVTDALGLSDEERQRSLDEGVRKLLSLAKNSNLPMPDGVDDAPWHLAMQGLIDHFSIDIEERDIERASELCARAYAQSLALVTSEACFNFDDMLWAPVALNLPFPRVPFIVGDEQQDTNALQAEIMSRSLLPAGKLAIVGDPHQAIYGFRGADSSAMDNLARRFSCETLPLSISYRCARLIGDEARKYVPHFESPESAAPGRVSRVGEFDFEEASPRPSDLIVCRLNAPAISLARDFLRHRLPFNLKGGYDYQKSLTRLLAKAAGVKDARALARTSMSLDSLASKLADWAQEELARLTRRRLLSRASALEDNLEVLADFFSDERYTTLSDLLNEFSRLFTQGSGTTISTIHKAKGLEADRVFVLGENLMPAPWAALAWEQVQERNIMYVAATRAKEELIYTYVERR